MRWTKGCGGRDREAEDEEWLQKGIKILLGIMENVLKLGDGCKTLKIDPKNSMQLKLYPTKVIQNSKNHVTIYMYLNFLF